MLHAVILAGGSGTRLWPLSREHYPKQFLQLLGPHTLLQQTVRRINDSIAAGQVWVITGKEQATLVRSQLCDLLGRKGVDVHILIEPQPKNTAAAIGLAAVVIRRIDPTGVMVVLPADHWIERQDVFLTLLQHAAVLAQQQKLVMLGIVPDRPETGYGYIRRGVPLVPSPNSLPTPIAGYHVEHFAEKPDLETAARYVASGTYYWNAGIFCWQATAILQEIAAYLPFLADGLEAVAPCLDRNTGQDALMALYAQLEPISIDTGVLERSTRLVMLAADIGWSDLGDWTAIHRLSPRDGRGNTLSPTVVDIESENSFVYGSGRTIATIGLRNTVVVDAEDALLICPTDRVQEVKTVVRHLQSRKMPVTYTSRTVQRPWGTYTVLEEGSGFKVKRLVIEPGAALSLQLHHYRNEQWVVVRGIAHVRNGEREYRLQVGQSTYVPQETLHRLTNGGKEPLEVIEVQTGPYLGEDDIVRFEDLYQRL